MNSIDEFLTSIRNARKRIGITKHPAWYRGHSHGDFELLPSLLRNKRGLRHERNLMAKFMNEAAGLIPRADMSSWEQLAVMQHHGAPTRLLDWTESVDIALFFAVWDVSQNPTIWVLNPYRLNYCSVGQNIIFDKADPVFYDYYAQIKDRRTVPHEKPIAMRAPWLNSRIEKQKGCFTVHGSSEKPLESHKKDKFVKRVNIPQHFVKKLRKNLRDEKRMNYFEIFPDLDGLCRSLKERFRLS